LCPGSTALRAKASDNTIAVLAIIQVVFTVFPLSVLLG
jgi:hypothetical protein